MEKFICCGCGKELPSKSGIFSNYGTNIAGEKFCYTCCAKNDLETIKAMEKDDRFCLYLTKDKKSGLWELSNFPSSLEIKVNYVKEGFHNIADVQRTCWFNIDGKKYIAKQYGNFSEVAYIKRYKGKKGENEVPTKICIN